MIVIGGEPPHVEEPEPRFGKVITTFNRLVYAVEQKTAGGNEGIKQKLLDIDSEMTEFVNNIVIPIEAHLAERGAVHDETRATVGLSKKDNLRTATLAEQRDLLPVDAFVTPQGSKAALEANNAQFVSSNYQQNDAFPFASYYMPDQYPIQAPTQVDPVRYFSADRYVGVLFNADRLIMSPISETGRYSGQNIFVTSAIGKAKRPQLSEVVGLSARYLSKGWNTSGADTSDGKVALFKPLADKKIYQYKNNLVLPVNSRNYLLFDSYAVATYKGLGTGYTANGANLTVSHRFFYSANPDIDPALTDLVGASYLALFDLMGRAQTSGPANGSHVISVLDYVTVPAGAAVNIGGNNDAGVVNSLFWNAQDVDAYLNLQIPVTVTLNGQTVYFVLNVTESIRPGTLLSGGNSVISTVGTRTKDVIGADLTIQGTPLRLRVNDVLDFNNPLHTPGGFVGGNEIVRSVAGKNGVRTKRYETSYTNPKDWLLDTNRPFVDSKLASSEMFVPSRHGCFTAWPERIIPYSQGATGYHYLVYGLNTATGQFGWQDMTWQDGMFVSTETTARIGIRLPFSSEEVKGLGLMPLGLAITSNQGVAGIGLSPMVFTTQNDFKGYDGVQYSNKTLILGNPLTLSPVSLLALQITAAQVMVRAAAANPTVNDDLRTAQLQVYAISANKVVVVISDGLCYAEAGIASYGVTNGSFVLDFLATDGLKTTQVTPGGRSVSGSHRVSSSADGVWMSFSDVHVAQTGTGSYNVVVSRPFGNLYGDLSFSVTGVTSAAPVFTQGRVNPARLYDNAYMIDFVNELYPAFTVPNRGLFQSVESNGQFSSEMIQVGGTKLFDPFDINEAGWVHVPAGGRAMIGGRAYLLDKDYAVKTNPTGTTYCYLIRQGNVLVALGSDVMRDPSGSEVLFGIAVNGVLTVNRHYIVMANHVISATRKGSAIPCFDDDGANGPNQFFTQRDVD